MKTLQQQFVPYSLAIKLKKLGFDEDCFGWYSPSNFYDYKISNSKLINLDMVPQNCSAPLWQQAFDWFRDVNNFDNWLVPVHYTFNGKMDHKKYTYVIEPINFDEYFSIDTDDYNTYEEARQACLEKLIEIIENKNYVNR